jgi:methionyl-tRNA formyltransferase
MNITLLCSESHHPIIPFLLKWIETNKLNQNINLIFNKDELNEGDLLFLISCHDIIDQSLRNKFKNTFVIHASDLPKGRGWSPHIWNILNGANKLTVTLLKAENEIDSGDIYKKIHINIEDHELWDEINEKLFNAEVQLLDYAVNSYDDLRGVQQNLEGESSFYKKRKPEDSKIDPHQSIKDQFNKIRVSDPNRYPAYFELNGVNYKLIIEKLNE